MRVEDLEQEAMQLTQESRARLAKKLLDSLDELSESERELLWLDESERRLRKLDSGQVEGRPAEEVIRQARAHLS